jgi:16S rRNA (guanine966-N2)-methyltransferase
MKDRTREAVFNLLGGKLDGYRVADLFAGSGVLALESLSRGASHAIAFELLPGAAREIKQNAEKLSVADRLTVIIGDTFRWAAKLPEDWDHWKLVTRKQSELKLDSTQADPATDGPWCVFICPPYRLWESDGDRLKALMSEWLNIIPIGSTMVVELDKSTPHEMLNAEIDWDIRDYFPAVIAIGDKK